MKFEKNISVAEIAAIINAEIIGNAVQQVKGINEIHRVEEGDLCFVDHPKYYDKCLQSAATFIIINNKDVTIPEGKTLLFTAEPFEAYLKIVNHFKPFTPAYKPIAASLSKGEGTVIMPNVFIGENVTIGKNCIIHPNVVVGNDTVIGDNVIIQSGTVIGGDAFYYNTKKNRDVWYKKMLSCGNVVLEDDVEVGCNCTIDRGVTSETRIGKGTKLDNQIHIGHDVVIKENCLLAAQVAVAGGVTIERGVTIWGQVGINKTLTIGANAVILARSGVASSIPGGKTYFGVPVSEARDKQKELVWIKRIPELWKKVMDNN